MDRRAVSDAAADYGWTAVSRWIRIAARRDGGAASGAGAAGDALLTGGEAGGRDGAASLAGHRTAEADCGRDRSGDSGGGNAARAAAGLRINSGGDHGR